ncbi:hypothetical protein EII34_11820 [Arachnia propionica]|uniref:Uncharacterized protein n=1 Tax=Arachnia propionica TaxID=1750 RepID=A0A3P1T3I3_9ACTN|nr:hypothetical protein [Arachnia propionica]MDO5082354.1 hypothetical protein [Arachnia propionica]RRD04062.1 hypothetical protein EII34_11820 [Arachnia propionica]
MIAEVSGTPKRTREAWLRRMATALKAAVPSLLALIALVVVKGHSDGHHPVSPREKSLTEIPANPLFLLRIVHTMTEAWLMADAEGSAS